VNGVHDMGGMHGFGPVVREPNEPVFHGQWERRVFALNMAMSAWRKWNQDASRFSRERMPPAEYLAASYYERWLWGLETLLVEHGLVTRDELARPGGRRAAAANPWPGALRPAEIEPLMRRRLYMRREVPDPPRFKPGDRVVARNLHPAGPTRLPRYVRGKPGSIDRHLGAYVFPDTNAMGEGEQPGHLYSVRFEARELWGPEADARAAVYLDLWDAYLDPA
jgi:nitrile hydratase subunit beta